MYPVEREAIDFIKNLDDVVNQIIKIGAVKARGLEWTRSTQVNPKQFQP